MASVPHRHRDVRLLRGALELDARHGIAAAVDNGHELDVAADAWRGMVCDMAADVAADEIRRRGA